MIKCGLCHRQFKSIRAIKSHFLQKRECSDHFNMFGYDSNNIEDQATALTHDQGNYDFIMDNNNTGAFDQTFTQDDTMLLLLNNELQSLQQKHIESGYNDIFDNQKVHQSQIELLNLLKKANAPLYLYDEIVDWTKKSIMSHNIDFASNDFGNRNTCLKNLQNQFDLNGLSPITKTIHLRGSQVEINLIVHNFKQCFYTLLNDDYLMSAENLLLPKKFKLNRADTKEYEEFEYNDIDSGEVYSKACQIYLQPDSNEVLCPIIFFIDKTHTDTHGRLCIEQIRFTLGIFNRKTRNNPLAWRTLGYIADQSYLPKISPQQKAIDYHHMIETILEDFKEAQSHKFLWNLHINNEIRQEVVFIIPVLYIIGDTDGHNKLAGRYTAQTKVKRLCRYCNIPFNDIDNPEFEYDYNKHFEIFETIKKANADTLQSLSMHNLQNAWEHIKFCDPERGLFGALCADVLHCLQHGLFNYAIQVLFEQKKQTSSKEDEYEIDFVSTRNVFSATYMQRFDSLTAKYGLLLSRQSDRNLPRTNISSNFTNTARKNANEMTGVLVVILIVFLTDEGIDLDKMMAEIQMTKYIKVLELLLLIENFCLAEGHTKHSINYFAEFIPYFLNYYKESLERQSGNVWKIIKFHLPCHFSDDIKRFGSMLNFDTGIGESHHKSEAKKPSKNTQRRKKNFELQTATRQIENIAICRGITNLQLSDTSKSNNICINEYENKWFRYIYTIENGLLKNKGKKKKNSNLQCSWEDKTFQSQLIYICNQLSLHKLLNGDLKFFTQHNRYQTIFRADPNYENDKPWYDWVYMKYNDDIIATKLLLFWEIEEDNFINPFQIGTSIIESKGLYAFVYCVESSSKIQPAHSTSNIVSYGQLKTDRNGVPVLSIIPLNCIHAVVSGVPYKADDDIINATEWLFLHSRQVWYEALIQFMENNIEI